MDFYFTYSETNPTSGGVFAFSFTKNASCDINESYIEEPIYHSTCDTTIVNDLHESLEQLYVTRPTGWTTPYGMYIYQRESTEYYLPVSLFTSAEVWVHDSKQNVYSGQIAPNTMGYIYGAVRNLTWIGYTNIPVFLTDTELNTYINMQDVTARRQYLKEHAINFSSGEVTPDGQDFRLEVQWTTSTWENDNQPTVTGQPNIQGVKGKITGGKLALYSIDGIDDGKLKFGIKNTASFYDLEYTTDGVNWTSTDTFPFDFIYRQRINELGTFSYALSYWNTDISQWLTEEDAQDYIDGLKPISDAVNWKTISSQYDPDNLTGDLDEITQMGEVFTRAFFSQQYICSANAVQEISNALFDTSSGGISGLWEDIKTGLEMYGDSPVDDIQGCTFYPINLNEVFTNVQSQNYIYFGGYRFDMQNNVNKIIYPNGVYDFGSFDIKPSFGGSYRDFAPYSRLFCYLAYIGWVELDIARYLGKTANIKYYIDTRTGGCLACIFANGVLVDYFNGQMGVSMPITATDYVGYANAQIQTLLTGASGVKGNANTMYQGAQGMAQAGMSAGSIAGAMLPVATAVAGLQGAKTLYGLTQNNINNFNKTIGSSTSMLNQYLPQYCMMMWEIQDGEETPNERALQGYPSNASNILSAFSGYLEVDAVNLSCPYATDNERAEIITYLKSGVYI